MPHMIRPELVFVQRWRMKCKYCGNQWDSEARADRRRVSCTKCRSSIRLESGWQERVLASQPRYFGIDPETGKEIELFPSNVSPPTTEESDMGKSKGKRNVKSSK